MKKFNAKLRTPFPVAYAKRKPTYEQRRLCKILQSPFYSRVKEIEKFYNL